MHWKKRYERAIAKKIQLIRDKTIRYALKEWYKKYPYLEEVKFNNFIADLLLLNPEKELVCGIEIKSDVERDLKKLPNQLRGYLKYCHRVWVATTFLMRKDVMKIVNQSEFYNVGVFLYRKTAEGIIFEELKPARLNDVSGASCDFITQRHKLHQWLYLLEGIWKG